MGAVFAGPRYFTGDAVFAGAFAAAFSIALLKAALILLITESMAVGPGIGLAIILVASARAASMFGPLAVTVDPSLNRTFTATWDDPVNTFSTLRPAPGSLLPQEPSHPETLQDASAVRMLDKKTSEPSSANVKSEKFGLYMVRPFMAQWL